MKIMFATSEAQFEPNDATGIPPVALTQPAYVEINAPDADVQITYNTIRVGPEGDVIAAYDDGFWTLAPDLQVLACAMVTGERVESKTIQTRGMLFTDITFSRDVVTEELQ